jgi:outer membrane biosynthesis protein TonB
MDAGDRIALGVAVVLHVALVAALSLSGVERPTPPVPPPPAVDVSLVTDIGLQSSAPKAIEAPAPSQAPDPGPPEDAAPPEPAPEPEPKPKPEPAPAPPKPLPDKRAPDKPAPAKPQAAVKPAVKALPPPPASPPASPPRSSSRTTPAAASAAAKPVAPRAAKPGAGTETAAVQPKRRGSRLSDDLVAGLTDKPSASKVVAPVGAVIDARALAGIQDAIKRQIQPCADRLSNAGIPQDAKRIIIKFNLRLNRDGNLAANPRVLDRLNSSDDTERYAQQIADLGIAAFKQCAPLRLPDEFYQTANGGWNNINYNWQLR